MENIKDKIKKLLSLASSSNENEARAALLKAKELMAKNKLTEVDLEESKKHKMVRLVCNEIKWTTDSGNIWMVDLCKILCDEYCCAIGWSTPRATRTHTAVIAGLDSDAEVCRLTIEYAVGVINNNIKALQRKLRNADPKSVASSYADGFCKGLEIAFDLQREEHPEWGLVVVKPQEVTDYEKSLGSRSVRTKSTSFVHMANLKGLEDGRNFNARKVLQG